MLKITRNANRKKPPARFIKFILLLCIIFLTPFICNFPGCTTVPPTPELFEQAWSTFDQNYSYFIHKNIDWNAVKQQYQQNFQQELDGNTFAEKLNEMLQVLHDWHVYVQKPNGEYLGYNGEYTTNYPPQLLPQYTQTGTYEKIGNDVIYHAMLKDNIAYIDIETFDTQAFKSVSDRDIENLFTTYAEADGMIIDIRANSGGNEDNVKKITSRFTNEPRIFGYVQIRNGPNHDDFDPPIKKTLEPSADTHFTKRTACLIGQRVMSSGEWCTLMMRVCPNVTLIGDTTRGASGSPKEFSLPNGVKYSVSTWVAYTYENVIFEDVGIEPDIKIPVEESYDDTHDYVLERAIAFIKGEAPSTTTTTTSSIPGGTTTSTSIPGGTTTTTVTSGIPVVDSFTVEPTTGQALVTQFTFTCQAHDPDGKGIQFYIWKTGDGWEDFTYFLSQYYWIYFTPGEYTATVQAVDMDYEYSAIASVNVTVTQ